MTPIRSVFSFCLPESSASSWQTFVEEELEPVLKDEASQGSAAAKVGFSTWCFSVGPIWARMGPTLKHHVLKPTLAAADYAVSGVQKSAQVPLV